LSALPSIALSNFIVVAGILIAQIITSFYRKRLLNTSNDPRDR
ncbi:MAG: small conductance mechanosensitive channel, partial [Saprospiraceae bacterium]